MLRKEKSYPVIQAFEKWMQASYPKVSPQSRMGRAISYTYALLPRLSRYVNDGRINIDNNLIENTIRPLALGRKSYLFCGNDASAGILKSKVAGHAPESDQDRTTCRQLDTTCTKSETRLRDLQYVVHRVLTYSLWTQKNWNRG